MNIRNQFLKSMSNKDELDRLDENFVNIDDWVFEVKKLRQVKSVKVDSGKFEVTINLTKNYFNSKEWRVISSNKAIVFLNILAPKKINIQLKPFIAKS